MCVEESMTRYIARPGYDDEIHRVRLYLRPRKNISTFGRIRYVYVHFVLMYVRYRRRKCVRTRLWIRSCLGSLALCMLLGLAYAQSSPPSRQSLEKLVDIGPTGIDVKRPLFAGACKACPWGVLASVTREALKPAGYDVQICWVCWSSYGPREMADRSKPVWPAEAVNVPKAYLELPPDAVPDMSATSEINLIAAWNGTGNYAKDERPRRNYRVIAAVQQPNFLMIAASKTSGITDLSQVKDRTKPTWIVIV